jgi:hypothetical protein
MKYSYRSYSRLNVSETGTLRIQVIDSVNNIPIPNALVIISKVSYSGQFYENAEGIVLSEFYTDYNGMVQVELPILNELMPNNNDFYIVSVTDDLYYPALIFNIQIYSGITSAYILYLYPRTDEVERFRFITQPRTRTVQEFR